MWHVSCGREFTPACSVGPLSVTMGQYSMLPVLQRLGVACSFARQNYTLTKVNICSFYYLKFCSYRT